MKQSRIEYRSEQQHKRIELVPIKTLGGEAKAWEALAGLKPKEVCAGADAGHDASSGAYALTAFSIDFLIAPATRTISSDDPRAALFLGRYKDFFRLSVLWYLTSAKDIPATGRLIRPLDVKGGQRFFTGTHVLPLDHVQERYGRDMAGFLAQGMKFGAQIVGLGDAAIRLYPLPRVPVTMILWLEDEEFPARATLFFDSTVDFQILLSDIAWSVAMMTTLVMLE
ncbi:MAG: DUF3786 domain-containing protein [Nitrospirota bacterium]